MRFRDLPKGRQRAALLSIGVFVFAVLFAAAEIAVRVRQWIKYGHAGSVQDVYVLDESIGLRVPIPNYELGPIKINSLGFRGMELNAADDGSRLRMAFLGASTTFCAEVSGNEKTWPHLVWKRLSERFSGTEFEYINGGVPGYTVRSSLLNLERRIAPLLPDVIVIYHATNDLAANGRKLAQAQARTEDLPEAPSWLTRYSLLLNLVEKNVAILFRESQSTDSSRKIAFEDEEIAAAFREDLTSLVRASKEVADVVVLVTFTNRLRRVQPEEDQTRAAVSHMYWMPYMTVEGLLRGFELYNQVIHEVAAAQGAVLVADELKIPADDRHFVDSVHFTDVGSEAMAERVVRVLAGHEAFLRLVAAEARE